MGLRWVARKEFAWARAHALPLLFVLVLLPGTFAYAALGFQHVLPRDSPVAVVPQDGATTDDDLSITAGALTTFSDPVRYDSRERAMRALEREQVYAVVTVPPRLADESRDTATFHVYTDGEMVPYREPSRAVASILQFSLGRVLPAPVEVRRHERGPGLTLSEYLVPTFLMVLTMLLAFTYLPYSLVRESRALDRVRVEASLGTAVAGKLATFGLLLVVPLAATGAASALLGYRVTVLAPGSLVVFPLTFLSLGAVAAAVTVASGFTTWGRLANLALFLVLSAFSGLVYPVGFFSAVRRAAIRLVPTHYAMIVARGHLLRGLGPGTYADMYALLVATAAVALGLLKLSTVCYERRA